MISDKVAFLYLQSPCLKATFPRVVGYINIPLMPTGNQTWLAGKSPIKVDFRINTSILQGISIAMWKITGWYEQLSWFPMKYHPFWCLNPAYMDSNIQQTSSSNGWFTNTRPQMSQIWAMPRLHPWYPTVLISYHSLYHPWWLDSSISKTKKTQYHVPQYPMISRTIP